MLTNLERLVKRRYFEKFYTMTYHELDQPRRNAKNDIRYDIIGEQVLQRCSFRYSYLFSRDISRSSIKGYPVKMICVRETNIGSALLAMLQVYR